MEAMLRDLIIFSSALWVILPCRPVSAQVWVLPESSPPALQNIIGEKLPLRGSERLETITTDKESATVCFSGVSEETWCVRLVHPGLAIEGDFEAGAFAIQAAAGFTVSRHLAAVTELAERLKKNESGRWWIKVSREDTADNDLEKFQAGIKQLLDENNTEAAGKQIELLEEKHPQAEETKWLRIRYKTQTGDLKGARKAISSISGDGGKSSRYALETARLLVFSGKIKAGVDAFAKLKQDRNKNGAGENTQDACNMIGQMAKALYSGNKKEEALALRRETVLRFPDCSETWLDLSTQILENDDASGLLALIEPFMEKSPDNPDLLYAQAIALRRLKHRRKALKVFRKLYDLTKNEDIIPIYSTIAARSIGDEDLFREISDLARNYPKNPLFTHAIGVMSYYRGDYHTAIHIMNAVKKKLPNDARVHIYGAMSRYELGDWEGAKKWLDELQKIGRSDPDLHYCLAVLHHRKDREKALSQLDLYLSTPASPDEDPKKRARAIEYRDDLVNGRDIPDWIPSSERGLLSYIPAWGYILPAMLVFFAGALAILRIQRKKKEKL